MCPSSWLMAMTTLAISLATAGAQDAKPAPASKPKRVAEKTLRWGAASNGLRAALAIRALPVELKKEGDADLYLVVQNVSEAPIRLSDAAAAPKVRELTFKQDGRIQMILGFKDPTRADVILQPGATASVLVVPTESKSVDGQRVGWVIAEGALKDTHQTLSLTLTIDVAPSGAWTGKLVTDETSGADAKGGPVEPRLVPAPSGLVDNAESSPIQRLRQGVRLADGLECDPRVALGAHLHADRALVADVVDRPEDMGVVHLAGARLVATGMVGDLEIADLVLVLADVAREVPLADLLVVAVEQHLHVRRADGP